MSTWIEDAPAFDECRHEPNLRGTACQHCGIPAEMVTPDELSDALMAEAVALRLRAAGQTGWLDEPTPESRCYQYLHTLGGTRRCVIEPDQHDGPHDYEPFITSMNGTRTAL